jgi:hypothetical protein
MLSFLGHDADLCDRLTRREWLRAGGLGAFSLSMAQLAAARAAARPDGSRNGV